MPTLNEDDTRAQERLDSLREREQGRMDDMGAAPLDDSEKARLDQMEAGLKNGDTADGGNSKGGQDGERSGLSKTADRVGQIARTAGAFVGGHKKAFGVGGGITGLIVSMIFGFFSLLPLKIESMMKNISGHYTERLDNAMERRVIRIVMRYAATASNQSGGVVATGSVLGDLYSTWRLNNFEKNLADKYNMKIERSTTPGKAIKITYGGEEVNAANEGELVEEFNHRSARVAVNDIIKQETKWYQVVRRAHLRRWMANAYGIKKWKVFEKKEGQEAKDGLDNELRTSTMESYKTRLSRAINCMFGDAAQCPGNDNTDSGDTDEAKSSDGKTVAEDAANSLDDPDIAKAATTDELEKALSESVVKKLGTKVIPIIGWIDLGARMDKLVWDNSTALIVKDLKKAQYASMFASWLTISDQIKDGTLVSGDEVNAAMLKLDGSEKSRASRCIYNDSCDTGVKVDDDKLFTTEKLDASRQAYMTLTGPIGYHDLMNAYLSSLGRVLDAIGDAAGWLLSKIPGMDTLNAFIGEYAMKAFMFILGPALTGNETGAELMNAIDVGGDVTANDFAQETGGQLMTVSQLRANNAAIAAAQDAEAKSRGWLWQFTSTDNPRSFTSQLANMIPYDPGRAVSEGTATAIASIANPAELFSGLFSKTMTAAVNPAYARGEETVDPYGIDQYGFTEANLDSAIDENALNEAANWAATNRDPEVKRADGSIDVMRMIASDCDLGADEPVTPNMCKLDLTSIQSLLPNYTTADDAGVNSLSGGDLSGNGVVGGSTDTGAEAPTGDVQQLAQQMLANANIRYWTNNGVNTRDVVVALSEGKAAYTTCANASNKTTSVNPNILKFILEAAAEGPIMVNALTDKCHSANSNHYKGQAVDLERTVGSVTVFNRIAAKYGGKKNSETSHHHYDFN